MEMAKPLSKHQFDQLFQDVCTWGNWETGDERGTLNYLTPEHVRAAAGLVRSGRTVSLALPIYTVAAPDNPRPSLHHMAKIFDQRATSGKPAFAGDFLATEIHGDCRTHVDALCHVAYEGKLYNGRHPGAVTSKGGSVMDVMNYSAGIVGRGVLLDLPRLFGVRWLEPGHAVTGEQLEAAEKAQGVVLGEGDIFLFRTGHSLRRKELGPWDVGYRDQGRAGLDATALPMLHARKIAAFFPDGDRDTVPSNVEGVDYPIHALQIVAMGMACGDSLQFEELVPICEQEMRWEFLFVADPLRIPGGTGSPWNPIAIF